MHDALIIVRLKTGLLMVVFLHRPPRLIENVFIPLSEYLLRSLLNKKIGSEHLTLPVQQRVKTAWKRLLIAALGLRPLN